MSETPIEPDPDRPVFEVDNPDVGIPPDPEETPALKPAESPDDPETPSH